MTPSTALRSTLTDRPGVAGAILVLALVSTRPELAAGQEDSSGAVQPAVTIVAGEEYAAGGLHRLIFGNSYRDLWATPIEVPLLDLQHEAGGLEPVMVVGRLQTLGLALRGADGRAYTFRGVYKDLVRGLPPQLQDTAVADIAQDQLAASVPGGPVAAVAIARAAGVLQPQPRLVVMPDDPRLGEFRERFAGLLGTIEEYPSVGDGSREGTFGAVELIDAEELIEMLAADPDVRVDELAFLRARLVDLLLGDWDRHVGQWRFARIPGDDAWQPIAEDRDQAFSRYDGMAMAFARNREPKLDRFGATYQGMEGLVWNARSMDRRLLTGRSRADFVAAARQIQADLTDAVIADAIGRLPAPYLDLRGEQLIAETRSRRDGLLAEAERFYEYLAGEVDVFATDRDDLIGIDLGADSVTVTVAKRPPDAPDSCDAPAAGEPVYRRTFLRGETGSIRLYVGRGADRIQVRGAERSPISVHVVGDVGEHRICTPGGRAVDFTGTDADRAGKGTTLMPRVHVAPAQSIAEEATPEESQGPMLRARRDWGATTYRTPIGGWAPDPGLILGMGWTRETYGFRKRPYSTSQTLRVGFAFGVLRPRIDYNGTFRTENRRFFWNVRSLVSGFEGLNYFGFGNETERADEVEFYRVKQWVAGVETRAAWSLGEHTTVSTGPRVRFTRTILDEDDERFINEDRPYGTDDTGQVGWVAGIQYNDRVFPGNRNLKESDDPFRFGPSPLGRGYTFSLDGAWYPQVWGLRDSYGIVDAQATGTWSAGEGTVFGVVLGGKTTWGDLPYYDAATIGSREVRGLRHNRFAGNHAAWANLGILQRIGKVTLVIPGRWGVLARADTGRVWLDGESSETWHWSWGGGLWWSPWDFATAVRIVAFRSDEETLVYFLMGFDI